MPLHLKWGKKVHSVRMTGISILLSASFKWPRLCFSAVCRPREWICSSRKTHYLLPRNPLPLAVKMKVIEWSNQVGLCQLCREWTLLHSRWRMMLSAGFWLLNWIYLLWITVKSLVLSSQALHFCTVFTSVLFTVNQSPRLTFENMTYMIFVHGIAC